MNSKKSIRRFEAGRLANLMADSRPFSYLRLGDGEVNWILNNSNKKQKYNVSYGYSNSTIPDSIDIAKCNAGLEIKYFDRLLTSFENCSYLDYYDQVNTPEALSLLPLKPKQSQQRNPPEISQIFYDFAKYEFKNYLQHHRVLFASAESPLLRELYKDERYRSLASDYFPSAADIYFAPIRDNGVRYSENLELIKEDLRQIIKSNKIDTLFLSLATAAKILCVELAQEENICTFDFGSLSRALTYSATPGYNAFRSSHNPFLFSIPLNIYLDALLLAYPSLKPSEQVAKAQAQLTLDLQKKVQGLSFSTSGGIDKSHFNLGLFHLNHSEYHRRYKKLIITDTEINMLNASFQKWRIRNGIGIDGIFFLYLVSFKKALKKMISFIKEIFLKIS